DRQQPAVRVERRRSIILILAVLACVPLPRDLQRIEVVRVDLIERRVARAPRVGAPVAPLAGLVAALERIIGLGVRLPDLENERAGDHYAASDGSEPTSHHGFALFAVVVLLGFLT